MLKAVIIRLMSGSAEKGSVNLLLVLIILSAVGILAASYIPISKKLDNNVKGVYLAKDGGGESGGSSRESSGDSHDAGGSSGGSSSSSGGSSSGSSDSSSKTSATSITAPVKTEVKKEVKTEIKTAETKQKIEIKESKIKTEFIQNGVKVEFELENGKVKVKIKDKNGKELEAKEAAEAKKEAEQEIENEGLKIATGGAQIAVSKNNVGAVSSFPLSINLATKQLLVTTPKGTKAVTVLPDQAVANMLNQGVISSVANSTSSVGGIPATTKLEDKNGTLVYEIDGVRVKKLLGLIPVNTPVKTFVSVENGSLVETEQSLLSSILNRISF